MKETVLVVDDDDAIRSLAAMLLRRAGHNVLTASTPGEAIAILATRVVAVVVTDVVLPEMTGYDFASEVRKFAPGVRFVFMSGYTNDQFRAPITDPFVPKPFSVGSLADAVAAALS
jgi:two-component system, cell cycle sensor histidine kinase and response regulator CckA